MCVYTYTEIDTKMHSFAKICACIHKLCIYEHLFRSSPFVTSWQIQLSLFLAVVWFWLFGGRVGGINITITKILLWEFLPSKDHPVSGCLTLSHCFLGILYLLLYLVSYFDCKLSLRAVFFVLHLFSAWPNGVPAHEKELIQSATKIWWEKENHLCWKWWFIKQMNHSENK